MSSSAHLVRCSRCLAENAHTHVQVPFLEPGQPCPICALRVNDRIAAALERIADALERRPVDIKLDDDQILDVMRRARRSGHALL